MNKTYKSKAKALRILVNVDSKIVPIEFEWDLIYPNSGVRGCSFTTDDEALQKAIESHEFFNREAEPNIWTDDTVAPEATAEVDGTQETVITKEATAETREDVSEVDTPTVETKTEFPDVKTMADARRVLKELFGKSHAEVKTNAQVQALINELGLELPNLK